jgi:8-oxo-dGTP diphosphatase
MKIWMTLLPAYCESVGDQQCIPPSSPGLGVVDRHPVGRVVTVAYYALVQTASIKLNTDKPPHPTWQSLEDLQSKPMAFDHKEILHESLLHIQNNILDVPVENMLPTHFTLSELQSLYEAILQLPLDKRNFRKKVLKLNLIRATSQVQKNVTHRPAKLFTFNRDGKESVL